MITSLSSRRMSILPLLFVVVAGAAFLVGEASEAEAQAATSCASHETFVGIYSGRTDTIFPNDDFPVQLDSHPDYCAELIFPDIFAQLEVADFKRFDVLWIGNDGCGGYDTDMDVVIARRHVWERAIDPTNVVVAGGDFCLLYTSPSPRDA